MPNKRHLRNLSPSGLKLAVEQVLLYRSRSEWAAFNRACRVDLLGVASPCDKHTFYVLRAVTVMRGKYRTVRYYGLMEDMLHGEVNYRAGVLDKLDYGTVYHTDGVCKCICYKMAKILMKRYDRELRQHAKG